MGLLFKYPYFKFTRIHWIRIKGKKMNKLVILRIGTETGGLVNKRTNRDHPNHNIVVVSQNTKSP